MKPSTDSNLDLFETLPRFKVLETEREFRVFLLPQDKLIARIIFVGTILIALLSMIPDSLTETDFSILQGLHLATFAFIFFTLIMLGNIIYTSTYRQFDLITASWWLGVIATVTTGNSFYPETMIIHTVFDVLVPVAIYLLIPIGLITQFLLATIFTLGNLFILFTLKSGTSSTETSFILVSYAAVHLLGLVACWQIHLGRRKQFLEHKSEIMTRVRLEETLAELKILRGILPICSYCKQIRDDEGYWHQVETYIRHHSGVDFTHGICPDCLKENFPREHKIISAREQKDLQTDD